MSYILDALRRADSERERGGVPGIHAQPVPARSADAEPGRGLPPWAWIVLGAGAGLLIALLWPFAADRGSVDPALAAAPPATAQPAAATVPAPPAPGTAAPTQPPAPATPGAATTATAVDEPPEAPEPAPRARRAEAPRATGDAPAADAPPAPRRAARRAPPADDAADGADAAAPARGARAVAKADAAAPPAKAPADPPVGRLDELPEEVRRDVPSMQIGGSIYSENAASRFLIVNGQTFREKDRLTADLVLEQIRLKSAVFRIREHRFELRY